MGQKAPMVPGGDESGCLRENCPSLGLAAQVAGFGAALNVAAGDAGRCDARGPRDLAPIGADQFASAPGARSLPIA